jgi:hypothetical protein
MTSTAIGVFIPESPQISNVLTTMFLGDRNSQLLYNVGTTLTYAVLSLTKMSLCDT